MTNKLKFDSANLPKDSGWQPISSVKRDGTTLDLYFPLPVGRVTDCFWNGCDWVSYQTIYKNGEPSNKVVNVIFPGSRATHWMPAPVAPAPLPKPVLDYASRAAGYRAGWDACQAWFLQLANKHTRVE